MKNKDMFEILDSIAQAIYDKKGFNILALDVRGVSTLTDFVVIAEGNVDRHVCALAHNVMDKMRSFGDYPANVEGMETGEWVVVDYFQVMVHIFKPEYREKYQLEKLWQKGKIVDLNIDVSSPAFPKASHM